MRRKDAKKREEFKLFFALLRVFAAHFFRPRQLIYDNRLLGSKRTIVTMDVAALPSPSLTMMVT